MTEGIYCKSPWQLRQNKDDEVMRPDWVRTSFCRCSFSSNNLLVSFTVSPLTLFDSLLCCSAFLVTLIAFNSSLPKSSILFVCCLIVASASNFAFTAWIFAASLSASLSFNFDVTACSLASLSRTLPISSSRFSNSAAKSASFPVLRLPFLLTNSVVRSFISPFRASISSFCFSFSSVIWPAYYYH